MFNYSLIVKFILFDTIDFPMKIVALSKYEYDHYPLIKSLERRKTI